MTTLTLTGVRAALAEWRAAAYDAAAARNAAGYGRIAARIAELEALEDELAAPAVARVAGAPRAR